MGYHLRGRAQRDMGRSYVQLQYGTVQYCTAPIRQWLCKADRWLSVCLNRLVSVCLSILCTGLPIVSESIGTCAAAWRESDTDWAPDRTRREEEEGGQGKRRKGVDDNAIAIYSLSRLKLIFIRYVIEMMCRSIGK